MQSYFLKKFQRFFFSMIFSFEALKKVKNPYPHQGPELLFRFCYEIPCIKRRSFIPANPKPQSEPKSNLVELLLLLMYPRYESSIFQFELWVIILSSGAFTISFSLIGENKVLFRMSFSGLFGDSAKGLHS